mmetsp:Transcript_24649/g.27524  ORF Transcript_24649/g.27524 Transcript_24649/m.27524 type:complete len:107 (-) Transcript_24649:227-547(-)
MSSMSNKHKYNSIYTHTKRKNYDCVNPNIWIGIHYHQQQQQQQQERRHRPQQQQHPSKLLGSVIEFMYSFTSSSSSLLGKVNRHDNKEKEDSSHEVKYLLRTQFIV